MLICSGIFEACCRSFRTQPEDEGPEPLGTLALLYVCTYLVELLFSLLEFKTSKEVSKTGWFKE